MHEHDISMGCDNHINNESYPTEHGIMTSMNITSTTLLINIAELLASTINIMQEHINNATMQAFNQLDAMEHA